MAHSINDKGEIVGYSDTATSSHAFLYRNGQMIDIHPQGAMTASRAWEINNSGQVVISATSPTGPYRLFLYENGQSKDIHGTRGIAMRAPLMTLVM
jgi:probable HAF family extracellular repeat protein